MNANIFFTEIIDFEKSNVVDLTVLYSRDEVDTPVRIRIA